jgi:hypothetical protein
MPRGRYIKWHQTNKQRWVGHDQWREKWVVDGWTLKKGVMLTREETNGDITITEFFDDKDTAMDIAEFINDNRGEW